MDETEIDAIFEEFLSEFREKPNDDSSCKGCKSVDTIVEDTHNGQHVCTECGLVSSDKLINEGPEYTWYDTTNPNPSRCGWTNPLLPEVLGSSMSGNTRMGKYNMWLSMTYHERSSYKLFVFIDNICTKNSLSKRISEGAKVYCKIIYDNRISRKSKKKGLLAACVYFSCKDAQASVSVEEVAYMFGYTPKIVTKGINLFLEIMRMSKESINTEADPYKSEDFVGRYSSKLDIPYDIQSKIKSVSERAELLGCVKNKTPQSIAAGCIYLVMNKLYPELEVSKELIAKACNGLSRTKCW